MKKFVSIILSIVLCLSIFPAYSFAAESYCTITVESASCDPGKNIVINISAKCKNGLKSIALTDFNYDSDVLTLIDGSVTASGAILSNFSLEDKNAVLAFSKNTVLDCVIATLTFSVAENAQPKDYPVTLSAVCKEKTTVETQVSTTVNAGDITVNCKHTNAQAGKGKEPTCLVPGLTAGIFCPDCGTWIVPQQEIKTKAHSFTELKTDGNYHWYKCANCDTINGKEAHKGGAATCTAKAKCSVCSKEYGNALRHDYKAVVTAPTCTADGYTTYTCSRCKDFYKSDTVKAPGHIAATDKAVPVTCTVAGKTEGSHCFVCGTVLTAQKTVPATGHRWDGGKVTTAATCAKEGVKTYTCAMCGATKTEKIAKTGDHKWDGGKVTAEPTYDRDGVKTFTCSVCKQTKTESIAKLEKTYTPGDVDGDGKITAADARLALRKSVGLEDYKEGSNKFLACDVDFDGKASAADARLILRASVGLENPQMWKKA